jgi:hypothetical protein
LEENCQHRPIQYLNNVLEQDHRAIKRRVRVSQGFRSFWGAWRTIAGYETIHMIRKGQACESAPGGAFCCTASFSLFSRRPTKLPIIYADFRLDYKLATLPLKMTGKSKTGAARRKLGSSSVHLCTLFALAFQENAQPVKNRDSLQRLLPRFAIRKKSSCCRKFAFKSRCVSV